MIAQAPSYLQILEWDSPRSRLLPPCGRGAEGAPPPAARPTTAPGSVATPQRDPRVRENEAYLTILLLSRVITKLGTLAQVHTGVIEGLFASDLAFLQDLYRRINQEGHTQASVTCPACSHAFAVDVAGEQRLGES